MRLRTGAWRLVVLGAATTIALSGSAPLGQTRNAGAQPPFPGDARRIPASDGDLIVVDGDARLRVIRQRPAVIRTIFNEDQRWLLVLADFAEAGGSADGLVDRSYNFRDIKDPWPFMDRWQGEAVIEEYWAVDRPGRGTGLRLPNGLVQLLGSPGSDEFKDPSAVAVLSHTGSGFGGVDRAPFDVAEQRALADLARNVQMRAQLPGNVERTVSGSFTTSTALHGGVVVSGNEAGGTAPVRVGSTIVTPKRMHYVAPVAPPTAVQAAVVGTVILEVTVEADGRVRSAKVLRSIPLLDAAALDAVRQWRYEPTLLNGVAVPVIITVPVTVQ